MPTELSAVLARNRLAEAQAQNDTTMMLISVIVCLFNIALLFLDKSYVAAVQLLGLY